MKDLNLYNLFRDEFEDNSQNQIFESISKRFKFYSFQELKEILNRRFKVTQQQIDRMKKPFSPLALPEQDKSWEALEEILKETDEVIEKKQKQLLWTLRLLVQLRKLNIIK